MSGVANKRNNKGNQNREIKDVFVLSMMSDILYMRRWISLSLS